MGGGGAVENSSYLYTLICIPTYNEANNIADLLYKILSLYPQLHILIIDDNSQDGTREIVKNIAQKYPNLHILERSGKMGLGSAYISGFLWGIEKGFLYFIQMDADFSHNPSYLKQTLCNLSYFDVVINSRNIIGGGVLGWGIFRRFLSSFGSLYARLWLGARIMDFTGGFNAYSKDILLALGLESITSNGYCFQIEMKYKALLAGAKIIELPIIFEDRVNGTSKMNKSIILEALYRVPLLRLRQR
ncbi:MAG: polyprenol monophosphomannose synthase [Helicobacter sp.]|nr:polyprenol monophosphomannose synthase [Helicobacter sp.]